MEKHHNARLLADQRYMSGWRPQLLLGRRVLKLPMGAGWRDYLASVFSPISIRAMSDGCQTARRVVAVSTMKGLRKAQAQTVATRHPARSSASHTAWSRATVAANFSAQNSGRVFGVVA